MEHFKHEYTQSYISVHSAVFVHTHSLLDAFLVYEFRRTISKATLQMHDHNAQAGLFQELCKLTAFFVHQTSGGTATAQVVHTQQRTPATPAASTEMVTIASSPGVRAAPSVTASAVVTTNLTPAQTQTRSLVTQVTPGEVLILKIFHFKNSYH